jgi:DNA-binding MarR family transcriptional regulator
MPTTRHLKEQEKTMGELLSAFRRKINTCIKKGTFEKELTLSQLEALMFIGPKDRKTMESIATNFDIAPPSATSLISKLEKRGLVVRTQDKKDRRMVYIELTPETKKMILNMWKQKEKVLNELVSTLTVADRDHFKRIMNTLTK